MPEATQTQAKVKTWKLHPDSSAYFKVTETAAFMGSSEKSFIVVDNNGITLRGSTSLGSMGEGQRTGGMFINMNEMVKMIPSAIVTPIPPLIPIPPLGFVVAVLGAVTAITALSTVS